MFYDTTYVGPSLDSKHENPLEGPLKIFFKEKQRFFITDMCIGHNISYPYWNLKFVLAKKWPSCYFLLLTCLYSRRSRIFKYGFLELSGNAIYVHNSS